ncbi:hypothetical protein [Desulfurococcus amylolyticus]|nr:hypothetical protein [Desulfurococcus amylolyticus]
MVKLRYPYCGHVWEYRGRSRFYATCTERLRKVRIDKNKVE